ncbi:MAG: hypothetical protein A2831_03645 [Candidatus Yanofskybacteria bacterium RIFCSPHIGHO2_01_FULL_44_17]|uniref:Uncharacterized protein n=1 Tax=Candidatus Yanofskybacteria bacterium RIFCSPHIGHO2_01_FULL_44_17 TaxID=1802668 RepID=A0A1F8EXY0_9BACT|nr:MAG: hypothetical protein A2831_03645 [Candidatus Yanofskybacteria bacterium RIFCSPHIGHO2_01_FULL_44_17]
MKKIVFDNSIHLGQFSITDESMRIASKNSQIMISEKSNDEIIGVESFNENTYSDDTIWGIPREPQDVFYKFMDVYHTLKNVDRIALSKEDTRKALEISEKLGIQISNALTCAIAIRVKAEEIHSFYSEFKKIEVAELLASESIILNNPSIEIENKFSEDNLEKYYQDALASFRKHGIDLAEKFHV